MKISIHRAVGMYCIGNANISVIWATRHKMSITILKSQLVSNNCKYLYFSDEVEYQIKYQISNTFKGPDHLESTILRITAKISLVI